MKQELIWELMKQAGELAYAEHTAKCLKEGLDPEHTVWSVTGAHYEKFAELIVGECLDIVANADMTELEGPDPEDVLYVACKQIQEHFGVGQ